MKKGKKKKPCYTTTLQATQHCYVVASKKKEVTHKTPLL
jgi:hypothetical protein